MSTHSRISVLPAMEARGSSPPPPPLYCLFLPTQMERYIRRLYLQTSLQTSDPDLYSLVGLLLPKGNKKKPWDDMGRSTKSMPAIRWWVTRCSPAQSEFPAGHSWLFCFSGYNHRYRWFLCSELFFCFCFLFFCCFFLLWFVSQSHPLCRRIECTRLNVVAPHI